MSRKINVIQPSTNFITRVAPNGDLDISFGIDYFENNSTSGLVTVKMSDTMDFASSTLYTPTVLSTRTMGTMTWTGSITGNTISSDDIYKEFKYTLTFPNENKLKYIKILFTEGANVYETNPVVVSSIYDLIFTLKNPIKKDTLPINIKVSDKKIVNNSSNLSIKIEATNNGFDTEPVWEDMTNEYINNKFYTFKNTLHTNASYGINIRCTFNKTSVTTRLDLLELYIAYS